jgi:DNA-binding response OmpR family regulator
MSAPGSADLHGLRILVVEDMLLIAETIMEELQDRGCRVVGPAGRLDQGLALATSEELEGALLDVNLAGERCFPIADKLAERSIPYAFLTGYGEGGIPAEYQHAPRLVKPFHARALIELVARSFARVRRETPG